MTADTPRDSQAPLDQAALHHLLEELNQFVHDAERTLSYKIDPKNGRLSLQVTESDSKTVICQVPPDELIEIANRVTNELSTKFRKK